MIRLVFSLLVATAVLNCGGQTIHNPSAILKETGRSPQVHLKAMELLDTSVGLADSDYQELMHRILWTPGYTNDARMAALTRLWLVDREGTIRTIRQRLPRLNNWNWLLELCTWIAEEDVKELHEALISSWASTTIFVKTDNERPECIALKRMYTDADIATLVFDSMLAQKKSWKQGYRTRCWELLHRLGQRDKLIALLAETSFESDDMFFLDLQKAKLDLGIVPLCREEILWIRELAKPEYDSFWQEAIGALNKLDSERRAHVEIRDIPVAVSLARHGKEDAFTRSVPTMVRGISDATANQKHYSETEGGGAYDPQSEMLRSYQEEITWGDAAAIEIALAALDVPQVRAHLFDYATRDNVDESTEYGGVIALDKQGRFEILEFEPKVRHHDLRFNASQDMFDAAYTALFHFHFHAQKFRNGDHAGPGLGDKNYATNTRANCLVFTFVDKNTMNVDYYRHGNVVIDLGIIKR
jgi:hypothetical protein